MLILTIRGQRRPGDAEGSKAYESGPVPPMACRGSRTTTPRESDHACAAVRLSARPVGPLQE
jgi:hypothetical protein